MPAASFQPLPMRLSPMPNSLGVLVNLPDAVKRNAVDLPLGIGELKGLRAFWGKAHFLQGNQDNPVLGSVVISQLKVRLPSTISPNSIVRRSIVALMPAGLPGPEPPFCERRYLFGRFAREPGIGAEFRHA